MPAPGSLMGGSLRFLLGGLLVAMSLVIKPCSAFASACTRRWASMAQCCSQSQRALPLISNAQTALSTQRSTRRCRGPLGHRSALDRTSERNNHDEPESRSLGARPPTAGSMAQAPLSMSAPMRGHRGPQVARPVLQATMATRRWRFIPCAAAAAGGGPKFAPIDPAAALAGKKTLAVAPTPLQAPPKDLRETEAAGPRVSGLAQCALLGT